MRGGKLTACVSVASVVSACGRCFCSSSAEASRVSSSFAALEGRLKGRTPKTTLVYGASLTRKKFEVKHSKFYLRRLDYSSEGHCFARSEFTHSSATSPEVGMAEEDRFEESMAGVEAEARDRDGGRRLRCSYIDVSQSRAPHIFGFFVLVSLYQPRRAYQFELRNIPGIAPIFRCFFMFFLSWPDAKASHEPSKPIRVEG